MPKSSSLSPTLTDIVDAMLVLMQFCDPLPTEVAPEPTREELVTACRTALSVLSTKANQMAMEL